MQDNCCPKTNHVPFFNFAQDTLNSPNNYPFGKENSLTLSNQSESLLVSSLRGSFDRNETSNGKKQKRLNGLCLNQ